MEKKIVTISREFGSGGRSIGRVVAEKLGYQFYDQELILEVAKESGLQKKLWSMKNMQRTKTAFYMQSQ